MHTYVLCVNVGQPQITEPSQQVLIFAGSLRVNCGQNALYSVRDYYVNNIRFRCDVDTGSQPLTWKVYKDGVLTQHRGSFTINNPTESVIGTYTFVLSSRFCGSAVKITRVLQRG